MLPKGYLFGNYRLVNRIGSGGMGEIYLAEDTRITRKVAIKIVRAEIDPYPDPIKTQEALRLFQREMRAITMLDHPNILPLFDFGEMQVDNIVITYMVMPFRAEGSLADWLQRRGNVEPLQPAEVAHIVQQAADALQHAHERQLIHQDVKPSNFLVRNRSDNSLPDVLLTDFGIAKINTATATASQSIRGTPAFMAPEQWNGQPNPATDQYALAIMAYLLLTGNTPFSGRMEQIMRHHFVTQPLPPGHTNPAIPPTLDAVILRALQKEPTQRFPSIALFAQAFQQASHTPASHRENNGAQVPPPPPYAPPPTPTLAANNSTGGMKWPKWKTLVSIVLAIGVLLISISGLNAHQKQVNQQNATATTIAHKATSTASVHATATAHIQATASVIAQATTTVQVQASATAVVIANNPYPSYLTGNGSLALLDPLNVEKAWHPDSNNSGGKCQFTGSSYHVSQSSTPYFEPCSANATFSNFAFEVQMTIIQGDCGGMIFRAEGIYQFYYFYICQDGSYEIAKFVDNKLSDSQTLGSGNSTFIAGLKRPNIIAVVANSDTLTFYVNKQQIDQEPDSSYTNGKIELTADPEHNHPTEVVYTNARVWTLQ